jgi:hypothetical protein
MKKYKGVVFVARAGASGDFLTNFFSLCANETNDNQAVLLYKEGSIGSMTSFQHIVNDDEISSGFKSKYFWNLWMYNDLTIEEINLFFRSNHFSCMNMHHPTIIDINYKKFISVLKLFNENSIKIFFVDIKDRFTALYTLYVLRNAHSVKAKNPEIEPITRSTIDRVVFMNEFLKSELKSNNIDFECIDLSSLINTRNFDELYYQINKSFKLRHKFSKENKLIVNRLWNNRIKQINKEYQIT